MTKRLIIIIIPLILTIIAFSVCDEASPSKEIINDYSTYEIIDNYNSLPGWTLSHTTTAKTNPYYNQDFCIDPDNQVVQAKIGGDIKYFCEHDLSGVRRYGILTEWNVDAAEVNITAFANRPTGHHIYFKLVGPFKKGQTFVASSMHPTIDLYYQRWDDIEIDKEPDENNYKYTYKAGTGSNFTIKYISYDSETNWLRGTFSGVLVNTPEEGSASTIEIEEGYFSFKLNPVTAE